ncbi:tripartite tricarboxylate transporter TctB family protein [Allorhizobium undicola]|uniref:tripartite tricarboxylate transporter TctB family protein n=1 Tax=Allorhizobium undicola TaxID=78527 RepID=UPI0004835740|nr:tripartite tricarboxylate transporter TctB family protein [Allorhizobium undicola]
MSIQGRFRFDQDMIGGLTLIAVSAGVLWLSSDLSQGSLASMGAGFLPRWLALAIGLIGVALVVNSMRSQTSAFGQASWRGVGLVLLAIIGFAVMIRPFSLGTITLPGLGIIVAGPFAVIVSGFATPEARLRELVALALMLTAFCMLLFGDLLNLPIPIFPQGLLKILPGISAKLLLRITAALMIGVSVAVILIKRQAGHVGGKAPVPVAEKRS